ncbi:MAG: carboxymuconolactone decarboxylase family protein [Streptosporangiaceae bacterium]|jgi:alkylhydroperoxidase family enzyme
MPLNPKRPRIAPLEPPHSAETAAALTLLGPPISLFRVWARRPELARGIAGWGQYYLSRKSALSLRHRELVIDRTTALCGADYEWGVHVSVFAVKAGLTEPQVRSLGSGQPEDLCWDDPADRAVLRAVDELHASSDLTDEGWDGLTSAVGEDGALDLLLLCGWYHAISFTVRALRLPMEPGTGPVPA